MLSSLVVYAAQINELLMEDEVVLLDMIMYSYFACNDAKLPAGLDRYRPETQT